jgi:putative CocE/NonD family hydrolase
MPYLENAQETMVPMRDEVKLHTEYLLPDGKGPHPVVFTRAYWPGSVVEARKFKAGGYAFVGQCTRGHGKSEGEGGEGTRFFFDKDDGYDALSWIAEQPWCDGNIAMYGKSYWGLTQWLVVPECHPNLKAIIPQVCHPLAWRRSYWVNGAITFGMTASGRALNINSKEERGKIEEMGWWNYFMHLPLYTLDEVLGRNNKLWKDYVTHSTFDDYWKKISLTPEDIEKVNIPVLQMGGWFDHYPGPQLATYNLLKKIGKVPDNRVAINPSDHLNAVFSDRDFGSDADKAEVALACRWLDYVMLGKDNGVKDEAPVKIFVMGTNQWRDEDAWPPARAKLTEYYIHSDGSRIGVLSNDSPGDEKPTEYIYDPDDPVPALGGNHSFFHKDVPVLRSGSVDQQPIEGRPDVLIFTSEPMKKDTGVIGPVMAKLYASSSAPDTDFIVRLIDVYPDGTAYNLTEGNIRARFREDILGPEKMMEPGKVYVFTIDMMSTANVFLKGHRIRIHISSSSFPAYDRNPNTGHKQGMDAEVQIARQTIYHDRKYPSHVILPVIKG